MTDAAALEELDPEIFGDGSRCFGCAPRHPIGLRLTFARDGDTIVTRFVPRDDLQGPPGILHGGLVATLADELAAWTIVGLKERMGFTAAFDGRLHEPIRIGVAVVGRGRIVADSRRIVKVAIELEQNEAIAFRGNFTFVLLDRNRAEKLLEQELPEAWACFCRSTD